MAHESLKSQFIAMLLVQAIFICGCTASQEKAGCNFSNTKDVSMWDMQKLDEAFELACELGTTTLVLITNGNVVKSMGDLQTSYRVHSARKALLSALVGQHVGTGPNQINLNSTLAELYINDSPNSLTELQQQATVLHLIKSISGINHKAAGEGLGMQPEKDRRLGHKPNLPGTIWAYNNWDYNALTTIFEQETGMTVYEAFKVGIAGPLEMQDFSENSVFYSADEKLSVHRKAGFKMSARDLAKFGLLYLNKGIWNGQQIIPKSWVERITIEYTLTGLEGPISGHSYLWWVPADQKSRDLGFPEGTYIAAGAFAQFVMVVPAWDTVVVHQVDSSRLIFCTNLLALRGYLGGISSAQSIKEAVLYTRNRCGNPEYSASYFCRKCAWFGNYTTFLDTPPGFVVMGELWFKIARARKSE